jgi:hypothetical protein
LIAEPLSHVLGLPPRLQNVRFSWCSSGRETERSPPTVLPWSAPRRDSF